MLPRNLYGILGVHVKILQDIVAPWGGDIRFVVFLNMPFHDDDVPGLGNGVEEVVKLVDFQDNEIMVLGIGG